MLSLLAEQLGSEKVFAGAADLLRLLRSRKYPLDLDHASVATTLEKLFKSELLLRQDTGSTHGYAFRMDLWRLWIRRQHSVWQVMREEGLEIRSDARKAQRTVLAVFAGLVLAVVVAGALLVPPLLGRRHTTTPTAAGDSVATLALEATPAAASILLDGRSAGSGAFHGEVAPHHEHHARLTAPGYADSEIVIRLGAGDSSHRQIALRELLGDVRIETRPPGAAVTVDGRAVGTGPVTVRALGAGRPHRVEATLAGHGSARQDVVPQAGALTPVKLALEVVPARLVVTTDPAGSEVHVDGQSRGGSPLTLTGLAPGSHAISVSHAGYLPNDTTVSVRAGDQEIRLALVTEPPGYLVVQGDRPAEIWVDGQIVKDGVQNSGPRQLPAGSHPVRVVFSSGQAIDTVVVVRPRERATYDYTRGSVTRRSQTESK